jgi:hypothetical protein
MCASNKIFCVELARPEGRNQKNNRGTEGIDGQIMASFAPLRELSVSRKGAKPAKQQCELLVIWLRLSRSEFAAVGLRSRPKHWHEISGRT